MKRREKRGKKSQRKRMDIDLGELKSIIARAGDGFTTGGSSAGSPVR